MTTRTEANPPTAIEVATSRVVESIDANARYFFTLCRVDHENKISEAQFRRVLALYFSSKSIADWCADLRIEDATDPADRPQT